MFFLATGRTFVVVLILESCGSSCGPEVSSILVADEGHCQVLFIDLILLLDDVGRAEEEVPDPAFVIVGLQRVEDHSLCLGSSLER